MMEMIKKHTVPDTGNWKSICPMVERTYQMLRMAKDATRSFVSFDAILERFALHRLHQTPSNTVQVPPSHQREQVPLGSSSASMYPGYSPADHEYGKAAFEYGKAVAEARAQGIDFKPGEDPDGPEYVIGQAKGEKRKPFGRKQGEEAGTSGAGSGSGSDAQTARNTENNRSANDGGQHARKSAEPANGDNPYFVIDTNPTPVHIPDMHQGHHKRSSADHSLSEPREEKKSKKIKTKHAESREETKVPLEDISEEVDARLKEKEEKRKRKEEKRKRKRESEGSASGALEATNGVGKADKHVNKRAKSEEVNGDVSAEQKVDKKKKRRNSEGEGAGADEGKKKKKRRTDSAEGEAS